jgi:hypothetical protein
MKYPVIIFKIWREYSYTLPTEETGICALKRNRVMSFIIFKDRTFFLLAQHDCPAVRDISHLLRHCSVWIF